MLGVENPNAQESDFSDGAASVKASESAQFLATHKNSISDDSKGARKRLLASDPRLRKSLRQLYDEKVRTERANGYVPMSTRAWQLKREAVIARAKGIKAPLAQQLTTGRKLAIRAMLDAGVPDRQVAIMEGVSKGTVSKIRHDPDLVELQPRYVDATRRVLASRFYVLADHALSHADKSAKLKKMNAYQLTMIGAVSLDKARLADGLSTENVAVRDMGEALAADIRSLHQKRDHMLRRLQSMGETVEPQAQP